MSYDLTKLTRLKSLKALADQVKLELDKKQDSLAFQTAYNKETNKVATMSDVTGAIEGLKGAMHFIGDSTRNPAAETTPGTQDGPAFSDDDKVANPALTSYVPAAGDVVTFGTKEFLFNGTKWREYGDEGDHAIKGSIKDSDIAADAGISKTKIAGEGEGKTLVDDLAGKADKVAGEGAKTDEILVADANGNMKASGKKVGGETLATEPDEDTVATEKAVAAAIGGQALVVASESGEGGAKGLMSPQDKEKLDTVKAGANKVEASTTLGNLLIDGEEVNIFGVATDAEVNEMLAEVFPAEANS